MRRLLPLLLVVSLMTMGRLSAQAPPDGNEPEFGSRKPIERVCRHISSYQRVALALPGTAWLQHDTGPRAVVYRLPMDLDEVEALMDKLQLDFASLAELGDAATDSQMSPGEGGEHCELRFYDHGEVTTIKYSGLDTLSPALSNVDLILDRLSTQVLETPIPTWDLADLKIGDLLRRRSDGVMFEYYIDTGDGLGAELHGVTQPVVVIETAAALPRLYDHLGSTSTRDN